MTDDEHAAMFRMRCDVRDFHMKFGLPSYLRFADVPVDLVEFRERFLAEESLEIAESFKSGDKAGTLDGLIDLAYIAIGTLYILGFREFEVVKEPPYVLNLQGLMSIDGGSKLSADSGPVLTAITFGCRNTALQLDFKFDEGWRRVCDANMRKVRAKSKDESKRGSSWDVVKPEGWLAPRMDDLV